MCLHYKSSRVLKLYSFFKLEFLMSYLNVFDGVCCDAVGRVEYGGDDSVDSEAHQFRHKLAQRRTRIHPGG